MKLKFRSVYHSFLTVEVAKLHLRKAILENKRKLVLVALLDVPKFNCRNDSVQSSQTVKTMNLKRRTRIYENAPPPRLNYRAGYAAALKLTLVDKNILNFILNCTQCPEKV